MNKKHYNNLTEAELLTISFALERHIKALQSHKELGSDEENDYAKALEHAVALKQRLDSDFEITINQKQIS